MRESRLRILVLFANYTDALSYYDDWLDALCAYPGFETIAVDIAAPQAQGRIRNAVREIDAVVLLHSTNADITVQLERQVGVLTERRVPLLIFVGNELNLPGRSIAAKRRIFSKLRPEWIATQMVEEAGRYLFDDVASRGVVSIPHALNPSVFHAKTDPKSRPIDIGSRVMRYPPHLGDDDRNRIAERFVRMGQEHEITVDISNARHDRNGWAEFLNRCKGTVSTEAGSWYIERDDETVNAIRKYTRELTGALEIADDSKLMGFAYRLPKPVRHLAAKLYRGLGGRFEYQSVAEEPCSYADLHARFFANKPRAPAYGKCISSRHFDAVGTKTCQIMFRGRFNDILDADKHYLALDHDFGNLDDVMRRFLDHDTRQAVVEAAHAAILGSHTYAHRMQQVYALLAEIVPVHPAMPTPGENQNRGAAP